MNSETAAVSAGERVDDAQVYALVGGAADAQCFPFGQVTVVLGPAGTVVVLEPSVGLDGSGVWNAVEVRLAGPAPVPVMERLLGRTWKWSIKGTPLPLHVMARLGEDLVLLGTGRVERAETELRPDSGEYELVLCVLRLDAPLHEVVLERVRPPLPPVELPGLEWLERVNGDCTAALEQFVTGWYPAIDRAPEEMPSAARPSPRLPDALRQLYRLAGARPQVLGRHNRIVPAQDLRIDDLGEMLDIAVENQGCFVWSLLWTLEDDESDPTVWFCEEPEEPVAEQEALSGFLLQYCLFEAVLSADYWAMPGSDSLTAHQIDRLTDGMHLVPLRPFWPGMNARFYVAPGLVMYVGEGDDNGFSAWAGALHRRVLAPLATVGVPWTRFDG
jgi:hypothetical protein